MTKGIMAKREPAQVVFVRIGGEVPRESIERGDSRLVRTVRFRM
jgi:hypothetical protein